MAKEMRKIQVCFNLLDAEQRMMYERVASYPNKSSYIKRLLLKELTQLAVPQFNSVANPVLFKEDIEVGDFI